jgi:uncharacterized protein YpmS
MYSEKLAKNLRQRNQKIRLCAIFSEYPISLVVAARQVAMSGNEEQLTMCNNEVQQQNTTTTTTTTTTNQIITRKIQASKSVAY